MSDTQRILRERGKTHGNFADNAALSQQLKSAMSSSKNWSALNTAQREALELVAVKISRILGGDKNYCDHWTDVAGYAELGREFSNTSLATVQKNLAEAVLPTISDITFVEEQGNEEKAPLFPMLFKK